ncbi:MAG: LCP family protein [Micrococcaceae bacterium]
MKFSLSKNPLFRSLSSVLYSIALPGSVQCLKTKNKSRFLLLAISIIIWLGVIALLIFHAKNKGKFFNFVNLQPVTIGLWVLGILVVLYWAYVQFRTLPLLEIRQLQNPFKQFGVLLLSLLLTVAVGAGVITNLFKIHKTKAAAVSQGFFNNANNDIKPVNGRYNFLIMGALDDGDKNPTGIMALSVDASTGETAAISLPHNLLGVPFPASSPLAKIYPNGFDCGANCRLEDLYTTVNQKYRSSYPNAKDPGAAAMKDAVSGALGIPIQAYLLTDFNGFQKVVDDLGGINLNINQEVPIGGDLQEDGVTRDSVTGNIAAGKNVKLNGKQAAWYARSIDYSNDFDRMARQRCVVSALLKQHSVSDVSAAFASEAINNKQLSTDIASNQINTFNELAQKGHQKKMLSMALGAPTFTVNFPINPDYDAAQSTVKQIISQASASGSDTQKTAQAPDGTVNEGQDQEQQLDNTPEGAEAYNQQDTDSGTTNNANFRLTDSAICSVP